MLNVTKNNKRGIKRQKEGIDIGTTDDTDLSEFTAIWDLMKTNGSWQKITDSSEKSSGLKTTDNWFIIKVKDASDIIEKLSEKGIPSHDMTGEYGKYHVTFPANYVKDVLKMVGKSNYSLEAGKYPNTFLLTFYGDIRITAPSSDLIAWEDLLPVIESMKSDYGITLHVDIPHGETLHPYPEVDGILYVHFWSVPEPTRKCHMSEAYDIELMDGQSDAFEPSGKGDSIVDHNGVIVAEHLNGNLYVLFDLPHVRSDSVTVIFEKIMNGYLVLKGKVEPAAMSAIHKMKGTSQSELSRDLFMRACNNLYERNLVNMEEVLTKYNKSVDEYNQHFINAMRERDVMLAKVEPLKESVQKRKEWANNEYDKLLATEHVKSVNVNYDTIQVYTDMVKIDYRGRTYNVGEFRIDIYINGRDSGVKLFNLTRNIGSTSHPHIKSDGHPCLGNIKVGVAKLLGTYEYVVLAQLMINYLHTYNPESAYSRLEDWK